MTRSQIRDTIRTNLADAGIAYYQDENINDVIQDAYNLIAAFTQCFPKNITLNWQPKLNYLDFLNQFGVADYMGCIAIFNIATNQWLRDDISMRDYDRIRRDWERWTGTPQFWTPHSLQYIAVVPHYNAVSGQQFILWYYTHAPVLISDSDSPLLANDMHDLMEFYSTADLLESAEETTKAGFWWEKFTPKLMSYKERCHNIAKYELLLRI